MMINYTKLLRKQQDLRILRDTLVTQNKSLQKEITENQECLKRVIIELQETQVLLEEAN